MSPPATPRTPAAEAARIADAEGRYRDLALACDQAVILSTDGTIAFVNEAAVGLFGAVQPAQLIDRALADFVVISAADAADDDATAAARYVDAEIRRLDDATVAVSLAQMPCRFNGRAALQIVVRDLAGRRQLERQVQFLARHDVLTEIPNRTEFRDRLDGAIARARRNARQVAVMLLNLDGFKSVNTRFGPDAGDAVLQAVAVRLKEAIRKADSVARVAGDEFGLILEAIDQREQAAVVANRVLTRLKEPIDAAGHKVEITASAGVAAFPSDAEDLDSLLRMTDVAMYAAKDGGRGTFRFYFPELEAMSQRDASRREQTAVRMATLTDREREVMDVLVEGNSNKSIAYLLGASPRTIENHRARVMEKMQADSLPDLVRMVLELKQRK
jgi:diguanylate cyclase (GGDEF)-like protein